MNTLLPITIKGVHTCGLVLTSGLLLLKLHKHKPYIFHTETLQEFLLNWTDLLVPYINKVKITRYKQYIQQKLIDSRAYTNWTVEHFVALQILILLLTNIIFYVGFYLILNIHSFALTVVSLTLPLLPILHLTQLANTRLRSCANDLCYFIDYVSLAISAGLDFNAALREALKTSPHSALNKEFITLLSDIELGLSIDEALTSLIKRTNIIGIRLFANTTIQSIRAGTDLTETLSDIAQTLRTTRFQKAEEEIGKISVKMMIPMMVFVLPSSMIILLGPMIIEWLEKAL